VLDARFPGFAADPVSNAATSLIARRIIRVALEGCRDANLAEFDRLAPT